MDGKTIVPAANELLRRKAYATAAQFIDPATPQQIRDFEAGIDDDAGLLLVAARTPSAERLSEIIRLLTAELGAIPFGSLEDEVLDELLQTAIDNDALPELRAVLDRVPAEARDRALARAPLADRRAELTTGA